MIEDVHFDLAWDSLEQVGAQAAVINLSDYVWMDVMLVKIMLEELTHFRVWAREDDGCICEVLGETLTILIRDRSRGHEVHATFTDHTTLEREIACETHRLVRDHEVKMMDREVGDERARIAL